MYKITGSSALNFHGVTDRKGDVDILVPDDVENIEYKKKGVDVIPVPRDIFNKFECVGSFVTPDHMLTLKVSHIFWNEKYDKHIQDIMLLQHKGYKVDEELYGLLYKHWCKVLGDKSFLSLKQDKENFFTDNIDYTFDHDYLHEIVAYNDRPLYEKVLKEGCDVLIDKSKFMSLSHEDQLNMVREECYAISLERFIIPHGTDKRRAYSSSLKKMVISLTKGWFARFVVDNYRFLYKLDKGHDFLEKFNNRSKNNDRFHNSTIER